MFLIFLYGIHTMDIIFVVMKLEAFFSYAWINKSSLIFILCTYYIYVNNSQ